MNPFVLSFIALCVAQGAVAQYGTQGYQQRKMSPSPQTYGQQSSYGMQQQQSYTAAPSSYESPSSAQMSTYEERTPAASGYGKQQQSYARPQQQQQSGYGQQQQSSYGQQQQTYAAAKPAAKYEEPSHPPQPFSWGYDISDGYGSAQYHKESGDEYGKRVGSYGYTDAYGIYRQVDYVADEHGFRATVKSNEPGLQKGAESPASTEFLVYDPPSNYYASNSYNQASSGASSYGSGKQSAYSAPGQTYTAAPAAQTYSAPAQQTYAPQRASYKQPAAMSSYSQQQQQQQQQYAAASSSVPTYQRASKAY